ncbi:MAG: ATP-dependent sacrificial sulfur transferase LarE [Verrucomicrobiota bacterium]
MSKPTHLKVEHLKVLLEQHARCLIAFSGGVDSAFLLWFATHQSRTQATGVLADSDSLKRSELDAAKAFCQSHQLKLTVVKTSELTNPDYAANPLNRCFYCKHTLFEEMEALARRQDVDALCYGENADDARHDRPGREAARKFQILAPLQQADLSKAEIRCLAEEYQLEVAEKKAQPCLASRIQHGVEVTSERLKTVESAENFIDSLGFEIVRVRHQGDSAKVQVAPDETERLLQPETSEKVIQKLKSLGFKQVELDQHGYQGAGLL